MIGTPSKPSGVVRFFTLSLSPLHPKRPLPSSNSRSLVLRRFRNKIKMKSIALSALAGAALASPGGQLRRAYHPDEFRTIGRSQPTEKVSFTVALKAQNVDVLEQRVLEISNPDHPDFGRWMSGEQVNKLLAPKAEDRAAVKKYFSKHGAKCDDWPQALRCTGSVKSVEKALGTKMTAFAHTAKNDKVIHRVHPDQTWQFPEALKGKVELISGLTDFPTVLRRGGSGVKAFKGGKEVEIGGHKNKKAGKKHGKKQDHHGRHLQSSTDGMIGLETIRSFYNLDKSVTGNMKSSVGAAEFQDDSSFLPSDLALFQGNNSVPLQAIPQNQIIGPFNNAQPDTEASLDVDYVAGVGSGNNMWYYTQQDWM
jgi:subtilase family serine protease